MLEKLHKMMVDSKLTPYLYKRCLSSFKSLPKSMQDQMLKDASLMSSVGVDSEDDHKHFMYVTMHTKFVANDIMAQSISDDQLAKISSIIYENRVIHPIDTIFNFYRAAHRAIRKLELPIKKVAYPVGMGGVIPDSPRDVNKWMNAMREIYARVHRGWDYNQAFNKVTDNWDIMEKQDFKAWKRFYTEGTQDKYKTAQSDYYQAEDGSPLLPFNALKYRMPGDRNHFDLPEHIEEDKQQQAEEAAIKEQEKKEAIEDARSKLLSRLTSAERIATKMNGVDDLVQTLGMDLDAWLTMLHSLKRTIQVAHVKSASSPILNDLIARRGNQLIHAGYVKPGRFLVSLAVDPPPPPAVEDIDLEGGEAAPGDPLNMGDPGVFEEEDDDAAMNDFVRMLNHDHISDDSDLDDLDSFDELIVEAQAPPMPPVPPMPEDMPMDELVEDPAIEVEEPPINSLDAAMGEVTIEGVIETLEMVANIIQNREIPRQLSFADMQMGKLGVATFFPALGEAIRSMLEAHQYTITRVEDILSKLRGSVQPTQQIHLTPDEESEEATSETLDAVRENLEKSEESDKARTEARKAKREAREVREAPTPEAPPAPPITPEEIAGPVEVESAPPIRAT